MTDWQIRPATLADAAGIARVHVGAWQTTYRGIFPDAMLAALDVERRTGLWQERLAAAPSPGQPQTMVAVQADGEVGGFASIGRARSGRTDFTGEVVAIYLLQEHQGQGLGRRLMGTAAEYLAGQGHESLIVWVAKANAPARGFYERMGGVLVDEKRGTYGSFTVDEVGYGWPELTTLIR